jgi:hypothetical protein
MRNTIFSFHRTLAKTNLHNNIEDSLKMWRQEKNIVGELREATLVPFDSSWFPFFIKTWPSLPNNKPFSQETPEAAFKLGFEIVKFWATL